LVVVVVGVGPGAGNIHGKIHGKGKGRDLVVGFDVQLDFFACQGANSGLGVSWGKECMRRGKGIGYLMFMVGCWRGSVGLDEGCGRGGLAP